MLSKKIKIMLLLCSILALGFIATSMVGYFVARDSLTKQISTDTLPLIGDNIYSEIQRDLLKPIIISSLMANDTFLKDWVIDGENETQQIAKYLKNIQANYNTVTSFFVSDKTLKYYHPTGIFKTISEKAPADQWYFDTKKNGNTHELNVDYDRYADNALTVFINYKLYDDNQQFLGITGVGLALTKVRTLLEQYQRKYQREVFFVDAAGEVTLRGSIYSGDIDFSQMNNGKTLKQQLLNFSNSSLTYHQGNNNILLDSRYIEEFNWYLMVRQSDQVLDKNIFDSLLVNLLISLVITITILTVTWLTLSSYQRQLEIMATTDKLTGLSNRHMLDPILEQMFKVSTRSNTALSALILDIDKFKDINDQYGHPFGDTILVEIAHLLKSSVRKSDVLCRWGGEEFLLLMPNCNATQVVSFIKQLQQKFADHNFYHEQQPIKIQWSVGVAHKNNTDKPSDFIYRADQALLLAKNSGRNQMVIA
ncbi:MAG: sensor domain-containing diguanylate cyclase [Oceanospirillaceae bacterium]